MHKGARTDLSRGREVTRVPTATHPGTRPSRRRTRSWNYVAVHAYGPVEFFEDAARFLDVITRLTHLHEQARRDRWAVADAPADFIKAQLKGIVGLRMPISRLDGKRRMSQNRNPPDRAGVINGLSESNRPEDQIVASLISKD
jgi:transcriptional regulator